jgi:hypothetical protein
VIGQLAVGLALFGVDVIEPFHHGMMAFVQQLCEEVFVHGVDHGAGAS